MNIKENHSFKEKGIYNMNKNAESVNYKRAFEALKNQKTSHMAKIIHYNPSFSGCPIDDFTNAIDLALLLLWPKFN